MTVPSSRDERPTVRAYGVAIRDGEVLMVRASSESNAPGVWWLPGGGVDFLESPNEAVIRELFEETGLIARFPVLVDVMSDTRTRSSGEVVHAIRIIYRVDVSEGDLVHEANGSTDFAQWISLDELHQLDVAAYAREAIDLVRQTK